MALADRAARLEPHRRGFLDLGIDLDGASVELGRRWLWSSSRLSVGVTGEADWRGEWAAGAGLRYEF